VDEEFVEEVFGRYFKQVAYEVTRSQLKIDARNIAADASSVILDLESMANVIRSGLANAQVIASQGAKEKYITENTTPDQLFRWVSDGKDCPNCSDRTGWSAMTWLEWDDVGTPGYGATICGGACQCDLVPE